MGREASKSDKRRKAWGDYEKFFRGRGIDIGCGPDPITSDCDRWDMPNGDATFMATVPDSHYDWVHSSHCLEHLADPWTGLKNWWRILKLGGHLIITVPDYTLYEHKQFPPSRRNGDHKWAFSLDHTTGPETREKRILTANEVIAMIPPPRQVLRMQVNDEGFDYTETTGKDQTCFGAQAEIEFIIKKQGSPLWTSSPST